MARQTRRKAFNPTGRIRSEEKPSNPKNCDNRPDSDRCGSTSRLTLDDDRSEAVEKTKTNEHRRQQRQCARAAEAWTPALVGVQTLSICTGFKSAYWLKYELALSVRNGLLKRANREIHQVSYASADRSDKTWVAFRSVLPASLATLPHHLPRLPVRPDLPGLVCEAFAVANGDGFLIV